MRRAHPAFVERGHTVVAIGQGTPARAARYRADLKLPFAVLGDREMIAYRAYGLGRADWLDLANPRLYAGGLRAIAAGSYLSKPEGDTRQLPGSFIIDPAGIVRYAKPGEVASDIAPADDLLAWIDARPAAAHRSTAGGLSAYEKGQKSKASEE